MTTSRTHLALAALSLVGAAAVLGGCTTSTSYRCSNDDCTVTLSGAGSSTEVGSSETEVALVSADGTTADFTVDGEAGSCAQGDSVSVSGFSATCTEVGDDRLVVELSPS